MFFGYRFYTKPNILTFKHKRTEYKKKEKGQLSNTIKKVELIVVPDGNPTPLY